MAQRIMKEQEFESDVFDRGTWQKVFQLLWEHKKSVIPLIFFNTILVVTDVIMPLLNRYALNTYVDDQTGADTLPVFILVYVVILVKICGRSAFASCRSRPFPILTALQTAG